MPDNPVFYIGCDGHLCARSYGATVDLGPAETVMARMADFLSAHDFEDRPLTSTVSAEEAQQAINERLSDRVTLPIVTLGEVGEQWVEGGEEDD